MDRWRCGFCEYVYDPRYGDPGNEVAPGTSYLILPDEWICPICGTDKDYFEIEGSTDTISAVAGEKYELSQMTSVY